MIGNGDDDNDDNNDEDDGCRRRFSTPVFSWVVDAGRQGEKSLVVASHIHAMRKEGTTY